MWTCISSVWFQLNEEMSKIVTKVLDNYPGSNSTTEQAWDFIQRNVSRTLWSAWIWPGIRYKDAPRSAPGGAAGWWSLLMKRVCSGSVDGVLRLDRSSGLERQHGDRQQLPAAVPLLLPEHLAGHRKLLRQRLLWGSDPRLARLRRGEQSLLSCRLISVPSLWSGLTLCLSAGLRCQRGELAAHQHRGRPRYLPGSRSDRGTQHHSEPTNPTETIWERIKLQLHKSQTNTVY